MVSEGGHGSRGQWFASPVVQEQFFRHLSVYVSISNSLIEAHSHLSFSNIPLISRATMTFPRAVLMVLVARAAPFFFRSDELSFAATQEDFLFYTHLATIDSS